MLGDLNPTRLTFYYPSGIGPLPLKEMEVQSEIYEDHHSYNRSTLLSNENILLELKFCQYSPVEHPAKIEEDEDGDLILDRKAYNIIEVECKGSTSLELVGLQVWRGALLLGDLILSSPELFAGRLVLELGSGTGLGGIVAGLLASEVICTDLNTGGILDLIRSNINRNKKNTKASFSVLPLDFYSDTFSPLLSERLPSVDIILAADVIYDNDLTDAFLKTVIKLLDTPGKKKKFYIALEKRYVFTLSELGSVAPCYEHFLTRLQRLSRRSPMAGWSVRQLSLPPLQQFFNYQRTGQLVLWEIST